ncbi:MAG TPA: metal-dependent hydrolase [Candidatus Paceibacterota bacterium]|nr:metal-dependent hydrolase [Candidatus Paceibacterota bacterium]
MTEINIQYLGHAGVLIQGSKTVVIDPFFKDNPKAALPLEKIPHVDFVLVTHDHFDHFGQAVELATRDKATLVAIHEVSQKPAVLDAKIKAVGMNIGGTYRQDGLAISMTDARHSAAVGNPAGFVIEMDGRRFYHAGDTSFFSDMALIPKLFGALDVAFLPIGGHYTMGPEQAGLAVKSLMPNLTIPIHYNTWPPITVDPKIFVEACAPQTVKLLAPGETLTL